MNEFTKNLPKIDEYEPSCTPIQDAIRRALKEREERVEGLRYGEVVAEVQDGKVVLLRVTEKYKPTPEHGRVLEGQHLGAPDDKRWFIECRCGAQLCGPTYANAKAHMEAHIANSK